MSNGTELSSLSESLATSLCKEFIKDNSKLTEQQCVLTGLYTEQLGAGSCEGSRDECVEELSVDCEADASVNELAECDATVGELGSASAIGLRCSKRPSLGSPAKAISRARESWRIRVPESCAVLAEKCPDEFGEEEAFASKSIRRFAARARKWNHARGLALDERAKLPVRNAPSCAIQPADVRLWKDCVSLSSASACHASTSSQRVYLVPEPAWGR